MYLEPSSKNRFTILAVGTCRLDVPLRAGAQARGIQWVRKRIYGYSHSILEAVQQVRFLQGDYAPDPSLWDVIAKQDLAKASLERFEPTDLSLVEISSRKQLSIDGHAVQINHLKTKCGPFFEDNQHKTRFWSVLRQGDRVGQKRMIDDFSGSIELTSDQRHLLHRLRLHDTTDEELVEGLRFIAGAFDDPIIVTHVDARTRRGARIPNRSACIQQVEAIAKQLGLTVFNPTAFMNELGQDRAIKDESESLAHFTDLFSKSLFDVWHRDLLAPRIDRIVANSSAPGDLRKYHAHLDACAQIDGADDCAARINALSVPTHPASLMLRDLLLRVQAKTGRFEKVQEIATQSVQDNDINSSILHHATMNAVQTANTALLLRCVESAIDAQLTEDNPWFRNALAALSKVDSPAALDVYRRLLQLDPELHLDLLPDLADLLERDGDLTNQIDLISIIAAVGVRYDAAILARLTLLAGAEVTASAQPAVEDQAIHERPMDSNAVDLSKLAEEAKDPTSKKELLLAALLIQPDLESAIRQMRALSKDCLKSARQAYADEDVQTLQAQMEDAQTLIPPVDHVPYFLSRLLYAGGDTQSAQDAAHIAVGLAPDQPRNWMLLLRASVHLGDILVAQNAARKMLETASGDDTKIIDEATKRLRVLERKILNRAKVAHGPWDAMRLLWTLRDCLYLHEQVDDSIRQALVSIALEIKFALAEGDVDSGLKLLQRVTKFCAIDPRYSQLIATSLKDADHFHVSLPVVQNLVGTGVNSSKNPDGIEVLQRYLLSFLQKEFVAKPHGT